MKNRDKTNYRLLRLAGFFIDGIFSQSFGFLVGYLISLINENIFYDNVGWIRANLIITSTCFSYFLFLEYFFNRTIGKLIIEMKVICINKAKPTFLQIFLRTICRIIPFDPISIFFSKNNRMWHDNISKTKVVRL